MYIISDESVALALNKCNGSLLFNNLPDFPLALTLSIDSNMTVIIAHDHNRAIDAANTISSIDFHIFAVVNFCIDIQIQVKHNLVLIEIVQSNLISKAVRDDAVGEELSAVGHRVAVAADVLQGKHAIC